MPTVYQSGEFSDWLRRLKDNTAAARITSRIRRLETGNPGDVRSLGGGVMEMRIDYGPGYRLYFTNRGTECCAAATNALNNAISNEHGQLRRNSNG